MTPALNMAQTAAVIGMSAVSFRKKRHWLVRDLGFPPPIDKGVRPLAWRPEEVAAWIGHRRQVLGARHLAPVNDEDGWRADRACRRRAAADREVLQSLMKRTG
jgi:predicted DNA-binding transcriptional regulator AlpA